MVAEEQQESFAGQSAGSIGGRLKAGREARGMSLADVSSSLRVSERHLKMIEDGAFADLPARTYAVGFTRSYARLVGLDEVAAVEEVRNLLDALQHDQFRRTGHSFEPGDPARVPSARLGWISALAVLLLLVGGAMFYRSFFSPAADLPPLTNPAEAVKPVQAAKPSAPASAPATVSGPVVFTALEEGIWVKFYDAKGSQLMQKQMARGETYVVPADAQGPQIWTGRPDALAITVGGRPVPKLGEREGRIKDVPVSAAALLARAATPPAAPTPTPAPAPASGTPAT